MSADLAHVRLEVLTVADPCPADFDAMPRVDGGRVRHCRHCDHHVFDLSAMTRDAAERLVAGRWATGQSLCVRLTKRLDGTVTTADDCRGRWRSAVARWGRRWGRRWGGPVGAVASLMLAVVGCERPILGTTLVMPPGKLPPPATLPTTAPSPQPSTRPATRDAG